MHAVKFVPIDCNGPTVAGPAPVVRRRNDRTSVPAVRRYWRARAASDDAHEPAPALHPGADFSVTVAISSSDVLLAQPVLRCR